jgi:hypothetical protein
MDCAVVVDSSELVVHRPLIFRRNKTARASIEARAGGREVAC